MGSSAEGGAGARRAAAEAGINIALVKYWGKRDDDLNLPAVGSLSLTLSPWGSRTEVRWEEGAPHSFTLNGVTAPDAKVERLLGRVRAAAWGEGARWGALVESHNSVPTAAGLASSASGMAALGLAAWAAAGLGGWDPARGALPAALLEAVRVGSGSAPRSLLGGLVRLEESGRALRQLAAPHEWPLALLVGVVSKGPKETSSRDGMGLTRETSPFYEAWVRDHPADLEEATRAVAARDLEALGEVMERSTYKMHACAWAARPPLRYLRGVSLDLLDAVVALRRAGVGAWATMDAGPHVKVLCAPSDAPRVERALRAVPGALDVLTLAPGAGARLVE
ncbi:MAG: diphosphomevalonate decarboxylase [Deltaproteobacteria bacterium]|nr:diphosphomevalonate decarboxylase [Deltaproteobacteria bacterium]